MNKLLSIQAIKAGTVDVAFSIPINEQQVVASALMGNVDVLAKLNRAFRPQKSREAVAPGRESVGRKPVDADILWPPVLRRVISSAFVPT